MPAEPKMRTVPLPADGWRNSNKLGSQRNRKSLDAGLNDLDLSIDRRVPNRRFMSDCGILDNHSFGNPKTSMGATLTLEAPVVFVTTMTSR